MNLFDELVKLFEGNRDEIKALEMKAYMRDQFEFYGIPKPIRAELEKDIVKQTTKLEKKEMLTLAHQLLSSNYRELNYTGFKILDKNNKRLDYSDCVNFFDWALTNSWWDSIDSYVIVLKRVFKSHPEWVSDYVDEANKRESFWNRRMGIICQLQMGENVDIEALKRAIAANKDNQEFFIQKAIGWILRDVGKTFPEVTKELVDEFELEGLAKREALKNLK